MRSSTALARVLALAMVVTATPLHLRAQQAPSGQTAPPSGRGSGSRGLGVREGWARPQGFSVVLVLGDLRAVAGEEDIPPAARKALTDMKDFLPYRSYRLLDAAWILCCSSTRAVTRLRGPDEHEYEIEIESGSADQNRTSVRFSLRDVTNLREAGAPRGGGPAICDTGDQRPGAGGFGCEGTARNGAREADAAASGHRAARVRASCRHAAPGRSEGCPDRRVRASSRRREAFARRSGGSEVWRSVDHEHQLHDGPRRDGCRGHVTIEREQQGAHRAAHGRTSEVGAVGTHSRQRQVTRTQFPNRSHPATDAHR